ncbi:MAG: DNA-binding protein [Nevskiaceae bacterium]|nr:MAG: DNA-binding protein [Nevskiaceae bacterium]TBR74587.1 MAG: DNA-binding protein [Nevskiaceae bacterium]
MSTLDLQQAAALLHVHPETLAEKARTGEIPGARIGRAWVFIEADLLAHIRAQYGSRALQGDSMEKLTCHSTNVRTHQFGGSSSHTRVAACKKALGLPIERRPRNITTSGNMNCGSNSDSA